MKVAIVGSRNFPKREKVLAYLATMRHSDVVVSGGARGVDTWAVEMAESVGMHTMVFSADWEKHGRGAGLIRNRLIVNEADKVVAFWDGESKGTQNTIATALHLRKNLEVIFP